MLWIKIKKHYYLSISAGSLILLLILFSPIIHLSWLAYPESLKIRIALNKLIDSYKLGNWCREDCGLKRLLYEDIITKALSHDAGAYQSLMDKQILNNNLTAEVRAELLKLYLINNSSASAQMKNFVVDSTNDFNARVQISKAWPEIKSPSLFSEIIGRYQASSKLDEKLSLLNFLSGQNDPLIISTLWSIVSGNDDEILKKQAFLLLANVNDQATVYSLADLDKIKKILEDNTYPPRLKDQAIFLLSDYYKYFPVPSELLLTSIINNDLYDLYQQTFAINILNNIKLGNLRLPELSQADWNIYYNN